MINGAKKLPTIVEEEKENDNESSCNDDEKILSTKAIIKKQASSQKVTSYNDGTKVVDLELHSSVENGEDDLKQVDSTRAILTNQNQQSMLLDVRNARKQRAETS